MRDSSILLNVSNLDVLIGLISDCTLWQLRGRRSIAYSVYCSLATPYCLPHVTRKVDSSEKNCTQPLGLRSAILNFMYPFQDGFTVSLPVRQRALKLMCMHNYIWTLTFRKASVSFSDQQAFTSSSGTSEPINVWALCWRLSSMSSSELYVDVWALCHRLYFYVDVCAFTSTSEPFVVVWVLCRCLSLMLTSEMLTSMSEWRRILIQTACHMVLPCRNFSTWRLEYTWLLYICTNMMNRKSYLVGCIGMRAT